jgi:hypothetical protein
MQPLDVHNTDSTGAWAKLEGAPLAGAGSTVPTDGDIGWETGALFMHTDGSAGDALYVNNGTNTSCNFDAVPTSGTSGAEDVGIADAGAFTANTNVEDALQEIYQHILSSQAYVPIPITSWRETTNFDVGDVIPGGGTETGGVLAADTTPVLSAINDATDGCQRLLWAGSNNDQIMCSLALPPDLDTSADVTLHFRIVSGGTTDAVGFTVDTFFNEGDTKVTDTSGTNQTTTYAEVVATIGAADVPAGAQAMTIGLTPVAHTTDTLAMTACWIEYTRTVLTS